MTPKKWIALVAAWSITTSSVAAPLAATNPVTQAHQANAPLDLNLPSLGTTADSSLSPSQERALGAKIMTQVRNDPTFMTDPVISEYLNTLGYRLVSAAKTYTYQFFFFPIRDPSLNAFALPGGYISMHTGTIIAARNESELAAVLSHEIGHVAQRHIARMIESQRSNLPLTIGSLLLAILAARAGGNSGGHAAAAIAMGSQAAMVQSYLNFSQDAEREADRIGLQTLYNAGFDPKGMSGFFERLQASNRLYESAAPAYLSTHPLTITRLSEMGERAKQLPSQIHHDSLEFKLVQMRARILQLTTHDAWLKESAQIERELATSNNSQQSAIAHYGLSVAYISLNRPKDAYKEAQLAMSAGQSPILSQNLTLTRYLAADNDAAREGALEQALRDTTRWPLSSAVAENYVDLLYRRGRHQELIHYLENNSILAGSSNFHALLARSYEKLGKKSEQYRHTGEMYAMMGDTEAAEYQYTRAQQANDGDFYTMSEIDARLRELRAQILQEKKER